MRLRRIYDRIVTSNMDQRQEFSMKVTEIPPSNWTAVASRRHGRLHFDVTVRTTPSQRIAQYAAKACVAADEQCVIAMEPLSTFTTVCVGSCGHVFSESVVDLEKCPLCRTATGWASVKIQ